MWCKEGILEFWRSPKSISSQSGFYSWVVECNFPQTFFTHARPHLTMSLELGDDDAGRG